MKKMIVLCCCLISLGHQGLSQCTPGEKTLEHNADSYKTFYSFVNRAIDLGEERRVCLLQLTWFVAANKDRTALAGFVADRAGRAQHPAGTMHPYGAQPTRCEFSRPFSKLPAHHSRRLGCRLNLAEVVP